MNAIETITRILKDLDKSKIHITKEGFEGYLKNLRMNLIVNTIKGMKPECIDKIHEYTGKLTSEQLKKHYSGG